MKEKKHKGSGFSKSLQKHKGSGFSDSLQQQQIQRVATKAAVPAGYCKSSRSSEYNGVKFENLPNFFLLKSYIFSKANNLVALLLPLLLKLKMSTTDFLIRKLQTISLLSAVEGSRYEVSSYLKQNFFWSLPHSNIHGVHPRKIGSGEFIDSHSIVSSNSWPPVDKFPQGGSIIFVSV